MIEIAGIILAGWLLKKGLDEKPKEKPQPRSVRIRAQLRRQGDWVEAAIEYEETSYPLWPSLERLIRRWALSLEQPTISRETWEDLEKVLHESGFKARE